MLLRIPNTGLVVALTSLIVLLFVNAVLTDRNTIGLQEDAQQVEHTHEVIIALYDVRSAVKDAETSQRGFLITGDERYLTTYTDGLASIDESLERLSILIADDPTERSHYTELQLRIEERLSELETRVALRKRAGLDPVREALLTDRSFQAMAGIRSQIETMLGAELAILDSRKAAATKNFHKALLIGQLSGGALIVLFVGTVLLIRRNVVARSRVSRALEEQHDLLRTTLASIVEGIIVTDMQGRVTFINPVAGQMTGHKLERAIGQPIASIYRARDELPREPAQDPVSIALGGVDVHAGLRRRILIAQDGEQLVIDESAAPLHDHDGQVVGVVLALRDITELRRTEKEIADAKAYAESIVDTIPDPLVILDRDLRIRSANLSYYEKYKAREAQTVGQLLLEVDGGRWNRPEVIALLEEVAATGEQNRVVEVEHDLPHLGPRTMVLLARGLRAAGEHAELILLAAQDESEARSSARRIQQLLKVAQENASRLRQIAAASLTLNSAHSRESVLRLLQDEARRILDVDEAVVTLDPTPPQPGQSELAAVLTGRGGQILGYVALAGSSRREDRLTESDESMLQQLAHVASVAIENARLYEELRTSDRRKDEFLATLAHELRNPLAPVRNSVQVLRSSRADGEDREQALGTIERQISLLVRLVDDLLDVSRITRGKIQLKRERVELAEVIGQVLEISRPIVHASGNTLAVQLPAEPVVLYADASRLAQVLSNLIHNAAKYTERGGHIWLTSRVEGDELLISVRDDGIGIPAEMLPHIFEMFWQLEHALERAQGGLGIGLSLVRQLVEMHGGTVEARSAGVGAGSEFVVHLRLRQADLVDVPPVPTAIAPRSALEKARIARRILVVDDNRDSAESLALFLRLQRHDVRMAHDGVQAVELAAEFAPELILLDIGLPRMNGYDAARAIRSQNHGSLTIVAMTGWGQAEDRRRSLEAGFDHHLVKPLDHDHLGRILAEL